MLTNATRLRAIVLLLAGLPWFGAAAAGDRLVLRDFVLFDGTGAPPRTIERMVIRDGTIESLHEPGEPTATDGEPAFAGEVLTELTLDGLFVIPGLIDTHVHLANFPPGHSVLARRLQWAVRGGVTTVRDLGGDARVLAEARRAVEAGEMPGPNLVYAAIFGGPTMFNHPALRGAARGFGPGQAPWQSALSDPDDIPLQLARARGAGVHAIKLYGDLDRDQIQALTGGARDQGLMLWAHATVFPARPSELVEAGVQSLSHAPYLVWEAVEQVPSDYRARTSAPYSKIPPDHPRILRLLDLMAERQVVLDATLAMFRDMSRYRPAQGIEWAREAFDWGVAVTRLAHQRGVPVSAGTDAFFPPVDHAPPNTHIEIQTLVEDVGMSPDEALVAATRNGALAAGIAETHGTIVPGKAADLLVLNGNPVDDIHATREIRYVVLNGQLMEPVNRGQAQ